MSWKNLVNVSRTTLVLTALALSAFAETPAAKNAQSRTVQGMNAAMPRLPLAFEANHGQTDARVKYLSRGAGYTVFLTDKQAYIALPAVNGTKDVVTLALRGAQEPKISAAEPLSTVTNYFLGNDPAKWRTGVRNFRAVQFAGVYPGIDLRYYGNQGALEYDFVVAPHADPSQIALRLDGTQHLYTDAQGNLVLQLKHGALTFKRPVIFQEIDGKHIPVDGEYALDGNVLKFKLGTYDRNRELVIDPVLNYAGYLGGVGGATAVAIAVDSSTGNAFVTGNSPDTSFPPTAIDVCQTSAPAACNAAGGIYVASVSPNGEALNYLSVVGGTGVDNATSIAVDASGNAFVGGNTTSANFPTTTGAFQAVQVSGQDGFFFKLNSTGTLLQYSTYLGSSGTDSINGIAVNGSNAYVTGVANNNFTGIPAAVIAKAFQPIVINSGNDAFVAKFQTAGGGGSDLLWYNYLGGDANDAAHGISVPAADRIWVTGETAKPTTTPFPTTAGVFQTTHDAGSNLDAFVTRMNSTSVTQAAGTLTLVRCRDDSNNHNIRATVTSHSFVPGAQIWVSGTTDIGAQTANGLHTITAVTATSFDWVDATNCNNTDDSTNFGLPAGSAVTGAITSSTFAGGDGNDVGLGIGVDGNSVAYVTGRTTSTNQFDAANTIQPTGNAGADQMAFILSTNADLTENYSAFIGEAGKVTTGTSVAMNPSCTTTCRPWLGGFTTALTRFNTNALIGALPGTQSGWAALVNSTGSALNVATYIGGTGSDSVNGVAVHNTTGSAYLAGTSTSTDLPVTASAYQTQPYAASNAFVARLSANNSATPVFTMTANDSVDPFANDGTNTLSTTYTFAIGTTAAATNPTFNMAIPQDVGKNDLITIGATTATGGSCTKRAGNATDGPGGVTCQLGNIGASGSATVTVVATPTPAATIGSMVNLTGSIASAEAPGAANPKTAAVATTVGEVIDPVVTASANSNVSTGANYKDTVDTSIDYTINIMNPSANPTDAAVSLNAVFTPPANFVFSAASPGCTNNTPSAGKVTCVANNINGGATASFTVTGSFTTVAAPATLHSDIDLTYTGTSTTQVFITSVNNQNIDTPINYLGPVSDLAITSLTVLPTPVNEGNTVTVTASYINNGPDPTNAKLTLTLSPSATADLPLPALCTQLTNVVTCDLGSLANGATGSRTITLPAPLSLTLPTDNFTVVANMVVNSAGVTDTTAGNNSATQSTTVQRKTALAFPLNALTAPASVSQSGAITYSLQINNGGPNTAQNVLIRFAVTNAGTYGLSGFTGATGCSLNAGNVDCTVDNITTAGKTITVTITPDAALLGTTFAFKTVSTSATFQSGASIDANGAFPLPTPSNAANTDVQRRTDLNLTAFTVAPNPTTQTGTIIVHVQVDNAAGTDTAQNVKLHYTLPANYNFSNISVGSCVTNLPAGTADCNIGAVTTSSPVNVNFTLTPPNNFVPVTSPDALLSAQITSVDSTAVVDGITGTKSAGPATTSVERRSNLGVSSFTVSPTPNANDGQQLTYTVNGGNVSGDTAEGVEFTLDFTSLGAGGFTLGTTTPPGVCSVTTATQVTCTVGQVVVGAGGNFSYTVPVTPPAGFLGGSASKAWKANATISGQVHDSTPANDAITNVTTNIQAQADLTLNMIANNSSGTNISTTNLNTVFSYLFDVKEQATVSGGGSPTPADNARVTFTLPNSSGRTFTATSINSGNFVCTVGGVAPVFPVAPGSTVVCVLSTTLNPGGASEQFEVFGTVDLPALQKSNTLPASATLDTVGPTVAETNAADNSANAPVILNRVADVNIGTIVATPGQPPVPPGTAYIEGTDTFTVLNIPIQNSGPDDISSANQVNLASAAMPVGTTFSAVNSDPSCSFAGLIVTCTNVAVPASGSTSLNVAITPPSQSSANSNFTTTWNVNTGAGAGTYNDANSANNNANSTVVIQRQGNISVAITPVIPGAGYVVAGPDFNQKIVYNVTVSATSPGANASNVPVSIVLPSGTTGVTTNIAGPDTCTPSLNTVNCTIQTLNAGSSVSFQVSGLPLLAVTQPDDPGVTANVSINPNSLNLVDQNATDDSATSAGIPLRGETDLQITVTSPPVPSPNFGRPASAVAPTSPDATLTYTINVLASNAAGMHPVKGLLIDHLIPTGTTLVSVSSASLGCVTMPCSFAGNIATGSPQTITVVVSVPPGAVPTQTTTLNYQVVGTGFGQPTIAANDTETAANNNNNNLTPTGAGAFTSIAEQSSDMAVTVPNPGLLQPGSTAHFMITVANVSNLNPSTGTTVVIPISASPLSDSSVVVGTPTQGTCNALTGGGTAAASVTCNLGAIAVGGSETIDLAVTPALPGQVQITPTVSVTNVDPNAGNNSASATLLTGNTPPGAGPISVNPANSVTGVTTPGVTITFLGNPTAVAAPGGNTTADVVAGTSPPGFQAPIAAYSVGTTAVFNTQTTPMCVTFSAAITKPERVRFFANGVDVTIATPPPATYSVTATGGTICGNVNTMNPAFGPGSVNVVIAEPINNAPFAAATNQSSTTSGKGLTGAGVTLFASPGSSDDPNNACFATFNGTPVTTCSDLDFDLITWTGQFTDGNVKQVQCTGPGGPTDLSSNPPKKPAGGGAGGCLQLDVSVPFGQQNVTLQITDQYGLTSNLASTQINSAASAGGSTTGAVTVNAGQSATYSVNVKGGGGTTTVSILSISPATNTITCSVTPSSFTGTGTPSLAVGCSTQAPIFASREPLPLPVSSDNGNVQLAGAIGITALPLFGLLVLPGRNRRSKRTKVLSLLGLVLLMTLFMGACGGGGSGSNFGGSATLQSSGTPKATYTITLGATGGQFDCPNACSSTKTLTLVVQ